jgi:hypothetical protein
MEKLELCITIFCYLVVLIFFGFIIKNNFDGEENSGI